MLTGDEEINYLGDDKDDDEDFDDFDEEELEDGSTRTVMHFHP